jgi:hypothetical protein
MLIMVIMLMGCTEAMQALPDGPDAKPDTMVEQDGWAAVDARVKVDKRPWLWDVGRPADSQRADQAGPDQLVLPPTDQAVPDLSILPPVDMAIPSDLAILPPVDTQAPADLKLPLDLFCPTEGQACNDGKWCTRNDAIDGIDCVCRGVPYVCPYSPPWYQCLVQRCDGTGGCYYAEQKPQQQYAGCLIDGKCYPEGTDFPGTPCLQCSALVDLHGWSLVTPGEEGSFCDPIQQPCSGGLQCKQNKCHCPCDPSVSGACSDLLYKTCSKTGWPYYICQ